VWSFWWWVWITATVLIAWVGGAVTFMVGVQKGWWTVHRLATTDD
jgi:hypothetical protein